MIEIKKKPFILGQSSAEEGKGNLALIYVWLVKKYLNYTTRIYYYDNSFNKSFNNNSDNCRHTAVRQPLQYIPT